MPVKIKWQFSLPSFNIKVCLVTHSSAVASLRNHDIFGLMSTLPIEVGNQK